MEPKEQTFAHSINNEVIIESEQEGCASDFITNDTSSLSFLLRNQFTKVLDDQFAKLDIFTRKQTPSFDVRPR